MNTWIEGAFRKMKVGDVFSEKDFPKLKLKQVLRTLSQGGHVHNVQKDIWQKDGDPPKTSTRVKPLRGPKL